MFSSWTRKGITDNKVALVITQIRDEAEHFNLDITDKFEN